MVLYCRYVYTLLNNRSVWLLDVLTLTHRRHRASRGGESASGDWYYKRLSGAGIYS